MLYLASQSPRRQEILKAMGVRFRVARSEYRERLVQKTAPGELVRRHALGKALGACLPKTARWVLGSDTLVYLRGQLLGKPKNHLQSIEMLKRLSGKRHSVFTGVALLDRKTGEAEVQAVETAVYFKRLSKADIEAYLEAVNTLDKAGGYAIQEGPKLVDHIEGSYSNVIGLPRELLRRWLRAHKLL